MVVPEGENAVKKPLPLKSLAVSALLSVSLLSVTLALPAMAQQKLSWDIDVDRAESHMMLRPADPRAVVPFKAVCGNKGYLEVWTGGPLTAIKKEGVPVTVTVSSNGKSASLTGKSKFNEFTKVMEVVIESNAANPFFDVLVTGKPVTATFEAKTGGSNGAGDKVTRQWPANDETWGPHFLANCKSRAEH